MTARTPILFSALIALSAASGLVTVPAFAQEQPAAAAAGQEDVQQPLALEEQPQDGIAAPAGAPATGEPEAVQDQASADQGHGAVHLEKQDWPFTGPFGAYDRASLQRGFRVYQQVCASCHSMSRLYYRDLQAIGFSEGQVKSIASEYSITDGPNDEGEMFERPGRPSDHFKAPFANRKAAAYANNGAVPPDMSLLSKARHGGADYIYGILTGYEDAPAGRELMPGQYWNKVMPGHLIAMAPPLADGQIAYEDGTEGTVHQYSYDVSQFLAWASEPHLEVRKRTGIKAFLFLLVFTLVMVAVKKKVWRNVHH